MNLLVELSHDLTAVSFAPFSFIADAASGEALGDIDESFFVLTDVPSAEVVASGP